MGNALQRGREAFDRRDWFAGATRCRPGLPPRSGHRRHRFRAARALLYEVADEVWAVALAGEELSMELRARVRAAGVWCAARAAAVVETAYRSGGGSSLYAESPLQRRLRDIHALTQHFLVRRNTLLTVGAVMPGQDVQVMVF